MELNFRGSFECVRFFFREGGNVCGRRRCRDGFVYVGVWFSFIFT